MGALDRILDVRWRGGNLAVLFRDSGRSPVRAVLASEGVSVSASATLCRCDMEKRPQCGRLQHRVLNIWRGNRSLPTLPANGRSEHSAVPCGCHRSGLRTTLSL